MHPANDTVATNAMPAKYASDHARSGGGRLAGGGAGTRYGCEGSSAITAIVAIPRAPAPHFTDDSRRHFSLYCRMIDSATQAGLVDPSSSTVTSTVSCAPPSMGSNARSFALPRIFEPAGTGVMK